MRDKVILGVTLSIVLLLTLVIYGVVDTQRQPATQAIVLEESVGTGQHIFAQYCAQCHGPLGEGCIGPALNRNTWRPRIGGADNPNYDDASRELILRTLITGKNSNQPGQQMPAQSIVNGGPLNDEELENVTDFIQYGDWGGVLQYTASAQNLGEPVPAYPGFDDPAKLAQVKELMLSKGCLTCHQLGKGGGAVGAILTDVGSRRDAEWLKNWIRDPKSVPAEKRGPNLWLVGPTATVPPPPGVPPNLTPVATPQRYPMNETYMPKIEMTEEELNLLVEYLARARTSTP